MMEKSSQNQNKMNNNDEIYLNGVVMEEEKWKKSLKFNQVCKHKKVLLHTKGKKK
jgi:hypothetical protein